MRIKTFLLACFVTHTCLTLRAQYQIPTSIPSPTATDLGKYGAFPVSFYTGRADISIPLYTLKIKGVEMPIGLSYDTSGVLINSLPGWVGQNWSVIAGGVITRTPNGRWDEFVTPTTFRENFTNYFHSYGCLPDLLQKPSSNYSELQNNVLYYKNDMEPDIFHFNFMGKTGAFFLGNDGEWKVYSDDNLEVVFNVDDAANYQETLFVSYPAQQWANAKEPKTIKGFLIRDDNGTKYYFGGSKDAIDYSINLYTASRGEFVYPWKADSWYLTKVTDKDDNVLYELNYERGCYIVQMYYALESMAYSNRASSPYGHYGCSYTTGIDHFPYNGIITSPVYLKKIQASDGQSVDFYSESLSDKKPYDLYSTLYYQQKLKDYYEMAKRVHLYNPTDTLFYCLQSNNPKYSCYQYKGSSTNKKEDPLATMALRKLNRISVRGGNINFVLKYDDAGSRFHLTNLDICSVEYNYASDKSHCGSYTFKYNNFAALPQDYLSTACDHWGYYNATENKISSLADYKKLANGRKPNPSVSKFGMLSEIVYPTGGTSVIEYEQNDFSQCLADDHQSMRDTTGYAGGLRIKSITEYEDENHSVKLQEKSYSYKRPGTNLSSGQLQSAPRYVWENWHDVTSGSHSSSQTSLYRSSSIIPLANSFGPHLGYSYIEEKRGDGSKICYEYSNFSDTGDCLYSTVLTADKPSPYDKFGDRSYKRGKLKSVCTYNASNKLMKSETYTYTENNLESKYVLATNLEFENTGNSGSFAHYNGRIYKVFFPKYNVEKATVKTGLEGNTISDVVSYQYGDYTINSTYQYPHSFGVRKLKSSSQNRNGKTLSESYSYPLDNSSDISNTMKNSLFWLPVVQTTKRENGTITLSEKTVYQNLQGKILPLCGITYKNGSVAADTVITYDKYNNKGTLLKYTKKGQPQTKLFWGRNDNLLVAEIQDLSNYIKDSELTVSDSDFKQDLLLKRFQSYRIYPFLYVTSYTYDSFNNVTSVTDPTGYTQYYDYDGLWRLSRIRDNQGNIIKQFNYQYKNP